MPTGGDGTAYMGEGINSALKAFSKLPAKQSLTLYEFIDFGARTVYIS